MLSVFEHRRMTEVLGKNLYHRVLGVLFAEQPGIGQAKEQIGIAVVGCRSVGSPVDWLAHLVLLTDNTHDHRKWSHAHKKFFKKRTAFQTPWRVFSASFSYVIMSGCGLEGAARPYGAFFGHLSVIRGCTGIC